MGGGTNPTSTPVPLPPDPTPTSTPSATPTASSGGTPTTATPTPAASASGTATAEDSFTPTAMPTSTVEAYDLGGSPGATFQRAILEAADPNVEIGGGVTEEDARDAIVAYLNYVDMDQPSDVLEAVGLINDLRGDQKVEMTKLAMLKFLYDKVSSSSGSENLQATIALYMMSYMASNEALKSSLTDKLAGHPDAINNLEKVSDQIRGRNPADVFDDLAMIPSDEAERESDANWNTGWWAGGGVVVGGGIGYGLVALGILSGPVGWGVMALAVLGLGGLGWGMASSQNTSKETRADLRENEDDLRDSIEEAAGGIVNSDNNSKDLVKYLDERVEGVEDGDSSGGDEEEDPDATPEGSPTPIPPGGG